MGAAILCENRDPGCNCLLAVPVVVVGTFPLARSAFWVVMWFREYYETGPEPLSRRLSSVLVSFASWLAREMVFRSSSKGFAPRMCTHDLQICPED